MNIPRIARIIGITALCLDVAAAQEGSSQDSRRNFVACPIVRDTKTVPCFLAEYNGETYFLTIQQDITADVYPPQLNHEVLVEGTVASGPRVCGGIPLKPLTISVMKELNRSCNIILPAEEGIDAPASYRGAGPSTKRPAGPPPAAPVAYTPPFAPRDFKVTFDFDSDFLTIRASRVLSEVVRFAAASKAAQVQISGYRAATLLSDGRTLSEGQRLAESRAQKVAEVLRGLGVPSSSVNVTWKADAESANGVMDPANRRVTITVKP
jgi:outer membrane protein OmpA-like peptidoglycan-associated protein